jgi:hypothetical protein
MTSDVAPVYMLSHNGKRKYSLATPYKLQRWIKQNYGDRYTGSYEINEHCLDKETAAHTLIQHLDAMTYGGERYGHKHP